MTDTETLIALLRSGCCAVSIHPIEDDGTPIRYGLLSLDGAYIDMPSGTRYGDEMRRWSRGHGHGYGSDVAERWETRGEESWRVLFWWKRDWSEG